jgi:RNA polymerase sigma-70 factor (ECF subfamily)
VHPVLRISSTCEIAGLALYLETVDDIIRDILGGNTSRFREIVREHSDSLLRIAYHFVRDWDEAKEVTQMTWINCYRNLRRYDLSRPFRPWLYRIHLNQCRSACRKLARQRHRFSPLENESRAIENPANGGDDALIYRCIGELSPKQKAAFILVEIEDYPSKEAANILGCAESTLRVHLSRARRNLRNKLKSLGFPHE